jgi:hypothetical protein
VVPQSLNRAPPVVGSGPAGDPSRRWAREVPGNGDRALVGEVHTVPGDANHLCRVSEEAGGTGATTT